MTTTQTDMDALMMDALDGTISPSGRIALRRYLAEHPDEAAAFERMAQVEAALRATPAAMPPAPFAGCVMEAIRLMPAAQPAPPPHVLLSKAQVAYVAFLTCIVAAIGAMLGLAALSQIEPAVAAQNLQALGAFVSNVMRIARDMLQVVYVFARAALSQPLVWAIGLGLGAIVLVWARIVAGVVASGLRARPVTAG